LADGDEAATVSVQRKIQSRSNAAERGGGVVDGDAGCRRAKVPEWRGSTAAVLFLCPSVRRRSAGGRRAEEEEGTAWVKEQVTPTPRIYTEEARDVEIVGSVPLPGRFRSKSPSGGMEWGGGFYNRATRP
jgi:hypothetical protein